MARWLAGVVAIAALWLVGFEQGERIPVLTYVNLGIHEFGHMVTYSASELTTALAGSIAQVAVPSLIALYFFFFRSDWLAAGVCLAWAATSAAEVALYVADAPTQELELIGGKHDWAFILGPDGYAAMDKAGSLADTIRNVGSVAIVLGFVVCLSAPLKTRREDRQRAQPEPMVATKRATAVSRP